MKKSKENAQSPNSSVLINNIKVDTYKEEIVNCNILEVEVGTTGHKGGDTGHGGRTYFKLSNLASTDMRCSIIGYTPNKGRTNISVDEVDDIELSFGGDSELDTFCKALQIGYEVLSKHAHPMGSYCPTPLDERRGKFENYINALCVLYRSQGNLRGMSELSKKHHTTAITKQLFFECDLHKATGYVNSDFCNKFYDYIRDSTKSSPIPKYCNL